MYEFGRRVSALDRTVLDMPGRGALKVTGKLGEVMRESAEIVTAGNLQQFLD